MEYLQAEDALACTRYWLPPRYRSNWHLWWCSMEHLIVMIYAKFWSVIFEIETFYDRLYMYVESTTTDLSRPDPTKIPDYVFTNTAK